MLTVKFLSGGQERLRALAALDIEGEPYGSDFVMYDGDAPVALWRMRIAFEDIPVGVIDRICFLDSVEEDDRVFFMHVMMFKLRDSSPLRLRYESGDEGERLKKFGFVETDKGLEINSEDINLFYNCGGRK